MAGRMVLLIDFRSGAILGNGVWKIRARRLREIYRDSKVRSYLKNHGLLKNV